MLQAYSALPFNITSGVTTVQGTRGPADRRTARSSRATPAIGSDFFSLSVRVSRTFRAGRPRASSRRWSKAFNLTNRQNDVTRNTNFGAGAYPTNPSPAFGQITGRRRAAVVPVRGAGQVLIAGTLPASSATPHTAATMRSSADWSTFDGPLNAHRRCPGSNEATRRVWSTSGR